MWLSLTFCKQNCAGSKIGQRDYNEAILAVSLIDRGLPLLLVIMLQKELAVKVAAGESAVHFGLTGDIASLEREVTQSPSSVRFHYKF